jgi:hypothetical protein
VAPVEMRELRRMLRYRNVVVAQAVRMKNKMSGLIPQQSADACIGLLEFVGDVS